MEIIARRDGSTSCNRNGGDLGVRQTDRAAQPSATGRNPGEGDGRGLIEGQNAPAEVFVEHRLDCLVQAPLLLPID
jgi:hypothetical protein